MIDFVRWLESLTQLLAVVLGFRTEILSRVDQLENKIMASFEELNAALDAVSVKVTEEVEQLAVLLEEVKAQVGAETAAKLDEAIAKANAIGSAVSGIVPPAEEPPAPVE